MTHSVPRSVANPLRDSFAGSLLFPDDDGYECARRVHNGSIDKHPALIARCHTTADVRDALELARREGLEVSVRGGGHNVAGNAVTDGGVMIDLAPMRGVRVAFSESIMSPSWVERRRDPIIWTLLGPRPMAFPPAFSDESHLTREGISLGQTAMGDQAHLP